ncbi:MAG: VWA domain-containing protein [Candidatus Nanopelagicales bacterium]
MHVNAHLDVDLVAVEATDTVTVMLDLKAPAAAEDPSAPRPEHTAIIVLDRSGSMSGGRLHAAKRAIIDLVARLDDRDHFGLVTFDSQVEVVIPAGKVGALGRESISRTVAAIGTRGMTDLSSGYLRGLQEARRVCGPAGATIVLLSDGHANSGITDPAQLRKVAANGGAQSITTSTIGIGDGYDESLLAEIATGGNGNHSFARDGDSAAAALTGEVEGLLSKTVQAASLLVAPTSDVAQIGILNDLPSHAVAGGIMVELGDFYAGEERRLLIELAVPAMAALGLAKAADLTLTYVELPALEQHTVTLPVSVNVVPADVAAGRVPSADVQREKLMLEAQKAKRASEEALAQGDFGAAGASLRSAAQAFAASPELLDGELQAEADWLKATESGLASWDAAYSSKRLRADRNRKSRGYKSRSQGGEVHTDDAGDDSSFI